MKYYSEVLDKTFATEKECLKAEQEHALALKKEEEAKAKMSEERAAAAKEVEKAAEALKAARENYRTKIHDFCQKYGTYHYSVKPTDLQDLFDEIWRDLLR